MKRLSVFVLFLLFSTIVFSQEMKYMIAIQKETETTGALVFSSNNINVYQKCWFKSTTPIQKGTIYTGAITYMTTKTDSVTGGKRPGIIIKEFGSRGIFIHEGTSVEWSENCIVIPREEMLKIWNYINDQGYLDQYVIQIVIV